QNNSLLEILWWLVFLTELRIFIFY
ncbi:tetratricopeptide repeat protein, partial [Haemophilus influenzae]